MSQNQFLRFLLKLKKKIVFQRNISIVTEWIPNEVSSTMVRRLLNRGKSVKYILNDNLIEYIKKNNLYGVNS